MPQVPLWRLAHHVPPLQRYHLRTVFQERSAKHASENIPADPEQDNKEEPESGETDDSILDLNTDDQPNDTTGYTSPTGVSAPAGLSPLQPASFSGGLKFVQPTIPPLRSAAFQTVLVSTTSSSVFFKMPAPVKPSASQDPLFSSAPDPQRLVPTPCAQMLKAHFEQQNM